MNHLDEPAVFTFPFISGIPFAKIVDVPALSGVNNMEWLLQQEEIKSKANLMATVIFCERMKQI